MAEKEKIKTTTTGLNTEGGEKDTESVKNKESVKDNEVTVSKELLQKILNKQQEQEDVIEKLKKDNERLAAVADKGRLSQYDIEHGGGTLIRKTKISMWDGHPVMGWQMVRDEVGKVDGVLREIQILKVLCDIGEEELKPYEVTYLDFSRNVKKLEGEIVEQSKSKNGETYTVELPDGKQYKMDVRFLN